MNQPNMALLFVFPSVNHGKKKKEHFETQKLMLGFFLSV